MFDISKYNPSDFTATYSPEDNKLRLYVDIRIDSEDWQLMKSNGWRWAPKQELFFAYWSVSNEDFCLLIGGDILPEEMTMVERAEAKADRLLLLAQKRSDQCHGYQLAANDLMVRVGNNQPILSGHHSERKAQKTQKQIERTIEKAEDTAQAVGYWVWRATGVIGHADHKNNTRTIYNRIKGLSKDLRDQQKSINSAAKTLNFIGIVRTKLNQEGKGRFTNGLCSEWSVRKFELNEKIASGELTVDQALDKLTELYTNSVKSKYRARVINHILNRLAYEQGQLSLVSLYGGELSPAILQTFLRAHGADKPKAEKSDYGWLVTSTVCLPLHLANSCDLELDDREWRELMQSVGYEVPAKRAPSAKAAIPILNFKADTQSGRRFNSCNTYKVKELTKQEYKDCGSDWNQTVMAECGTYRFRLAYAKTGVTDKWGSDVKEWQAIFLTDSKVHNIPETAQPGQIALV